MTDRRPRQDDLLILREPVPCPHCGARLQAHIGLDGLSAQEGDLTMCERCGALLVLTPDLGVREVLTDDLVGLTVGDVLRLYVLREAMRVTRQQEGSHEEVERIGRSLSSRVDSER